MVSDPLISTDYWTDLQITRQDVEFLHNHLFELETPLTVRELVSVFIEERIRIYNPTETVRPYYFWNCTAVPNTSRASTTTGP